MRKIDVSLIEKNIEKLFIQANYDLPEDVKKAIDLAIKKESSKESKEILNILKTNYEISSERQYPLCQDTGISVVFLEIGQEILLVGGYLNDAVKSGVEKAYNKGYLRKSVVKDPLRRENSGNNLPPIIHTEIKKGDKLKITVVPKGFGSENQSGLKMLIPSDGKEGVIDFVVNGVINSGGKGCPPGIVGVGIGGNFEYSAYLSKKALLIPLDKPNPDPFYREIEEEIFQKINKSGVGGLGLGGDVTCLGIRILTYGTHIAGLPVAYNYCCHSCRHSSVEI